MTSLRRAVLWTAVALHDLERLSVQLHSDAPFDAEQVLERIIARVDSLGVFLGRGRRPPELGSREPQWLEVIEAPWRILYRVIDRTAEIHGIFDGRRDLRQILLERAYGFR